jgi:hypothetical protein
VDASVVSGKKKSKCIWNILRLWWYIFLKTQYLALCRLYMWTWRNNHVAPTSTAHTHCTLLGQHDFNKYWTHGLLLWSELSSSNGSHSVSFCIII